MKKLNLLFILIISLLLSACSSSQSKNTDTTSPTSTDSNNNDNNIESIYKNGQTYEINGTIYSEPIISNNGSVSFQMMTVSGLVNIVTSNYINCPCLEIGNTIYLKGIYNGTIEIEEYGTSTTVEINNFYINQSIQYDGKEYLSQLEVNSTQPITDNIETTINISNETTTQKEIETTVPKETETTTQNITTPQLENVPHELLYSYNGSGDYVISNIKVEQGYIVKYVCDSNEHTAVKAHYDNDYELLVNEVGNYIGYTLLPKSSDNLLLEITANSNWTLEIYKMGTSNIDSFSGNGDYVTPIFISTSNIYTITNNGDSNFVVRGYNEDFEYDLLINEIGNYNGTILFKNANKYSFFEIISNGEWHIEASN